MTERTEHGGQAQRAGRAQGHEGTPDRLSVTERTEQDVTNHPPAGVWNTILGKDEEDDRPLPDLPPLPADPRWRIEHLPFVLAVGFALVLCAGSVGFFVDGPTAALGAALGMLVITLGINLTTLAIAWADVIRPELVMPVGLTVYLIKYALIAVLMLTVLSRGWAGGDAMAWSMAAGVVVLTAVQVWWLLRIAARRLAQ